MHAIGSMRVATQEGVQVSRFRQHALNNDDWIPYSDRQRVLFSHPASQWASASAPWRWTFCCCCSCSGRCSSCRFGPHFRRPTWPGSLFKPYCTHAAIPPAEACPLYLLLSPSVRAIPLLQVRQPPNLPAAAALLLPAPHPVLTHLVKLQLSAAVRVRLVHHLGDAFPADPTRLDITCY